jgi:inosose dehydratase
MYVNSVLHDPEEAQDNINAIVRLAKTAKVLGVQIIVTNPSPIRWGGDEDKTDDQLKVQADALDQLGSQLREIDLTLAYHNHDAEMRHSAREFHHMMLGTDPENVKLCLDAHWIYRGSGNSQVALFDIVKLYQDRIAELHLRQSKEGIWTEAFGPGDIDYERLADLLKAKGQQPHLVLEQAVEKGTPHTMNGVQAHQQGLAYVKQVFKNT